MLLSAPSSLESREGETCFSSLLFVDSRTVLRFLKIIPSKAKGSLK